MDPVSATSKATYPLIGQVVGGRYHIVGLIGEGGMGVVYKAEQRLGSAVRRVAVKTLHAELSRDPSITARFHREVGTVAQLEHPNTVRVYDFGSTDDGTLYIAMEFLDGRALNRVIESDGALDPRRVGNLVRQVAGSLDEAHRQGIVHRDLKPENVLLIERAGEKDVVKLVDFGIAARTESAEREKEQKLTQQGMVLGTPPYMSPEQFTGKALDARSDVYSLGVMVYEMLTGQLPFRGDTPWEWATHHMTSPPRSFEETDGGRRIPDALRRTVLKALAKDPAERQNSAGQFYTEYVASLGSMTSVAPAKPPPSAAARTEAMPEATPLAMAPTEGMPAAVTPAAPPPVALPRAPEPPAAKGNRSLIYGLAGVGAVLLVAMGVVAVTSERDGGEAPPLILGPAASGTPAATEPELSASATTEEKSPDPEPPATAEPTAEPAPASAPPQSPPSKPPAKAAPAKTQPAKKPAPPAPSPQPSAPAPTAPAPSPAPPVAAPSNPPPQAPSSPPTPAPQAPTPSAPAPSRPPAPAPTTPSPAPAGDACAACGRAAASRDIPGAHQAYLRCSDPSGRQQCATRVAQVAPRLAESAAFNQDCAQARAIISAATQMGVPESRFGRASAACK